MIWTDTLHWNLPASSYARELQALRITHNNRQAMNILFIAI
jgi:hypothetical protein